MPVRTQAPQAAALPQTVCKAIPIGTPKFSRRIPSANRRIQTSRLTISRRIKSNHSRVNRMPGRNSVRVIWLEESHPRAGKGTLSPSPRRTNTDCCQAVPRGHKPPLSLAATHSSSQGNRVSLMPMAGEVSNTSLRTPRSVQTEESTLSQQPFVKSTTRANGTSHTGRILS